MHRRTVVGGVALSVAVAAGWSFLRPSATTLPLAADAQEGDVDTSLVKEMSLGAADAPVTIYEYASFTCPHCATFHNGVFQQIKENYIDTGRVRFVYREVYFDRFGLWAAMVARCGDGQRYFGIVDLLYDRQRQWLGEGDPSTVASNLRTIGKTAGFGEEQVQACLADADMAQALVAVYQQNAGADNIDSTPSFVIDGQKYGNMSYEDFAGILDEKLAQ